MEDEADEDGAIDAALLATAGDPLVGDTIRRVQRKRLGFLERCFLDMGLPPAESRQRARIAYAVYLGWFRLRQAAGAEGPRRSRARRLPAHGARRCSPAPRLSTRAARPGRGRRARGGP